MKSQAQHIKRSVDSIAATFEVLHHHLEELKSALLDFEESLGGQERQERPRAQQGGVDLLSITEVCQELGMGKSWVHRRVKNGEIPSIRLGHNIKVRREELEEYLESRRYRPLEGQQVPSEE